MVQVSPVSQQIWDMKYRLKTLDGEALDKTIDDTWRRVARELARTGRAGDLGGTLFSSHAGFQVPARRPHPLGRRFRRRVTLFNCFVMGDVPDDMAGSSSI